MSWGERSCLKPCRVPELCTRENCNVNCIGYKWDGETKPDSKCEADIKQSEIEAASESIQYASFKKKKKKKKKNNTFGKYF